MLVELWICDRWTTVLTRGPHGVRKTICWKTKRKLCFFLVASASDFQRLHNAISTNLTKISNNGEFSRLYRFISMLTFSNGSRKTRPEIGYARRQ